MRLCANENVSEGCVLGLRKLGHDVLWIREVSPGIPDGQVLAVALRENRVLVTFDKDFGELVFRKGATASHGIILFRISQTRPELVAERVASAVGLRDDWTGHFTVVEDAIIRMRVLPT